MDNINADNLWDVRVHIYVIGYPSQGESIITIFSEGNTILKSIVTDCYSDIGCDCISDILNSYNNPKIDWFVWTHPHEDHSKGIPELLECFDKNHNSHIFIPSNLHNIHKNFENLLCADARDALTYLKTNYCPKANIGPRRHRNYHTVQFDPDSFGPVCYRFFIQDALSNSVIPICLSVLGPDNIASLHNSDGTIQLKENALSIVYTLDINRLVVFMAGDITHSGAKVIPDEYFHNFHFLKIPHHGSNEPQAFYNRIILNEVKESIGVTTKFSRQQLPKPEAMQVYTRDLGTVFSTHSINKGASFGYVHVQYNPMELRLAGLPEIYGNADIYV